MALYNFIWWFVFFIIAIVAQSILSGIDFLLVGVIIALQERRIGQLIWVILVAILLQEGMGTLPFGSALLWYVSAIVVFYGGRALFEAENFVFIFLISAILGVLHYLFIFSVASLHDLAINSTRLLWECAIQVMIIPLLWRLAYFLRRNVKVSEDRA